MNLEKIYIREEVIKAIRAFFESQKFHEVIVPVFNTALPLEPTLYSFKTEWRTLSSSKDLYLTISPESGLKKMLSQGLGNCYAIGKCFRNLENSGLRHNPEFLMLEWYRENADYRDIMRDTQDLVRAVGRHLGRETEFGIQDQWEELSLETLFEKHADIALSKIIEDEALRQIAIQKGYSTENSTWEQLFDQIFLNEIEPHLPETPFFLIDFPARLSPLCKINRERPYLAQRFECYLGGMEIGNGNNENTNAMSILTAFRQENKMREERGESTHPIDLEFIEALEKMDASGKSYAGIGLGVDRLAMLMAGTNDIRDVEPFSLTP